MSYCFNPDCQTPQNPDPVSYCQNCGQALLLKDCYQAIKLLGQGGFGRTLLAVDVQKQAETGNSACVIKQFLPRSLNEATKAKALILFQQEAQRLAELGQHPQIPNFVDFFQDGEYWYLVQEYIAGWTLAQQLAEQGVLTEPQIWQILTDLLPVLKFIHDRQVIHRDIKPENIIYPTTHGSAMHRPATHGPASHAPLVLVDFGAAKVVTPLAYLQTGTTIGSAEYAAPEQVRGKAVFASDLYSLGVTCIHLLTGLSPFDLVDSAHNTWIWQQVVTTPVSSELCSILDRLIHPALSQRFPSADAVLQAMPIVPSSGDSDDRCQPAADRALIRPSLSDISWHCEHILSGHTAAVNTVTLSPDGNWIASGSHDKTVRLWDFATGQEMKCLLQAAPVLSVAFNAEGTLLAIGGQDQTVRLWSVATQQEYLTLAGHTQAVKTMTLHPQQPFLASGSSDKTIRLWDLRTGELVTTLPQHRLPVNALAFSPDGTWLASGSSDRSVCLWRIQTDNHKLTVTHQRTLTDHVDSVLAVAFSPDSKTLATSGDDRTIKLWDLAQGQLKQTLSAHSWSVSALSFSPLGRGSAPWIGARFLISAGWDAVLKLWPIANAGIQPSLVSLSGHTNSIHAIAVSAMSADLSFQIVSASRDRSLRIWRCNREHPR